MYVIANGGLKEYGVNTIESILLTKNTSKIDGVLIDVRLTKDNQLVTIKHDDLAKDTLGKGMVSRTNYYDLKKIKLLNKTNKQYIPSLEEVLDKYNCKKIIVLNLHDALGKNEVLVNETINLICKYPEYNFYLETSSPNVLEHLIVNNICRINTPYKIGLKFNNHPPVCNGRIAFCDTLSSVINENINTYNNILVSNVNNQNDLINLFKYIDEDRVKDLIIVSDNPMSIKTYLKEKKVYGSQRDN